MLALPQGYWFSDSIALFFYKSNLFETSLPALKISFHFGLFMLNKFIDDKEVKSSIQNLNPFATQ